MKGRRTLADAKILMERHQMSGLNIQAFCTKELINPATFYYWRKRLRMNENPESSLLIPVSINRNALSDSPTGSNMIELNYPNGVRLTVSCQNDFSLIRELIMLA